MRLLWCPLNDGGRSFVYSPRLGATYLLDRDQLANTVLLSLLGLRSSARVERLEDPVCRVGVAGAYEKELPSTVIAGWMQPESEALVRRLGRWYRMFHRHRHVFEPAHVDRWARLLSRSIGPHSMTLRDLAEDRIAKLVAATEHQVGFADCYPRSLLTGALCAVSGFRFTITIGILAPTAKLHAWCSSEGTLLYEPTPRHWWYQPLADFRSWHPDDASVG